MHNLKDKIRWAAANLNQIFTRKKNHLLWLEGESKSDSIINRKALFVKKYGTSFTKSLLIKLYHNDKVSRDFFNDAGISLAASSKTGAIYVLAGFIKLTKKDIKKIVSDDNLEKIPELTDDDFEKIEEIFGCAIEDFSYFKDVDINSIPDKTSEFVNSIESAIKEFQNNPPQEDTTCADMIADSITEIEWEICRMITQKMECNKSTFTKKNK